jgi:mannose-6-phosphate isomerase-like protein (cupin superfamily)
MTENEGRLAWVANVEEATLENADFRRVLFTGGQLQLTVMSLPPGESIGWEMHDHLDQFLRVESGRATLHLGRSGDAVDEEHELTGDWAIVVPGGTWHNVINAGDEPLQLYSLSAPPDHPDGTVHPTTADAEADEDDEPDRHGPDPAGE